LESKCEEIQSKYLLLAFFFGFVFEQLATLVALALLVTLALLVALALFAVFAPFLAPFIEDVDPLVAVGLRDLFVC